MENYTPLCGKTLGEIGFKSGQLLIMQFRHLDLGPASQGPLFSPSALGGR